MTARQLEKARRNGWSILVRANGSWTAADFAATEKDARDAAGGFRKGGTRRVEVRHCAFSDAQRIAAARNERRAA